MKVKVMYYDKRFENKPEKWEIAECVKNLKQTEIEISELAEGLSNGATFKPANLSGTKSIDWIDQQLFALDFDHNTTISEELNRCSELNILPCFGYTSFRHSEQEHHFRLIFCADEIITDKDKRNKLQETLIALFSNSDVVTKDETRQFFGGRSLICSDYENRINADVIIDKYYVEPIKTVKKIIITDNTNSVKSIKQPTTYKSDPNHILKIEAIKSLNVNVMQSILKVGLVKEDYISSSIKTDIQLPSLKVYSDKEGYIPSSITVEKQLAFEFKSDVELYDYINTIDLQEYLGIYGYVNCILPDHDDSSPSAHIYITDDGTPVYKCHGCDSGAYTIISITEELAHCKRSEAIEFIKAVYNISLLQSDWSLKQKQLMINSANYLDSIDFNLKFPALASLIRTRKLHIQKILMHFTQYVNDNQQVNGKPFFYASYNTLMEVCNIRKDNPIILSQTLTLFSLVNMIVKLQITDIPEKELKEAKHIAATHGYKKLTNFYSFEEYGVNSLYESEEIAKQLKKDNMTLKGLSREYVYRTYGEQKANKIFPQYIYENSQGTTEKSNEHTLEISECLFYLLDKKGYATEKDLVYLLAEKYSCQSTEIQIKKSLQEILLSYGLVRVKASNDNKIKYDIKTDLSYQSYIICKDIQRNEEV